jgi:cytochrome P450 / NADPH-cytochrome P450 reductase
MVDGAASAQLEPIPQPPGKPIVGNLFELESGAAVQSLNRLARDYGPIFKISVMGREAIFVWGFALADELCDTQRFDKLPGAGARQARAFAGDGLFTTDTDNPNWQKAHRILMPAFSQQAMQAYFPEMLDIAVQLVKKWQRLNPGDEINVPADTTRLTLDTIGLCGFGYRFNSFYRERPHPFVEAMTRCLVEAMDRTSRLPVQDRVSVREHRQFDADVQSMNALVDRLIEERLAQPEQPGARPDLLGYMLNTVDKQTGERLDDVNIRYQVINFLVAGHETTSGLLSFTLYALLHHPEVLARAYEEVDRVLGSDPSARASIEQVRQLRYLTQILNEALRLWPPAPGFTVHSLADETIIGGKYRLTRDQPVMILTAMLHRDPSVWGPDAEEFNPDHFSPEAQAQRPANAFKAFGNGQRACIGRQFAMQEATLALGMILQNFELIDDRHYQLAIKETLTQKPDGFTIQVRRRRTTPARTDTVGAAATGSKA